MFGLIVDFVELTNQFHRRIYINSQYSEQGDNCNSTSQ